MTATTVDEIDTRSTWQRQLDEETPADEFSEAEMNMIDIAAVHVYKKARAVLPSELIDFRDEDRKDDPAGVIRQWAYQWALENPSEIHGWPNGQIIKNVRRSLREKLNEYLHGYRRKAVQRPNGRPGRLHELPGGSNMEAFERGAQALESDKHAAQNMFGKARPVKRPQPIKYSGEASRLRGERAAEAIDHLGVIPDPDKWQFALTGKTQNPFDDGRGAYIERGGKTVFTVPDRFTWEDREKFAKLHTRRPSRAEYWRGVLDGNSHRTARNDLAADTELHANTIAAIVEDVAPAVSERFSTGPRPVDSEDVDRKRLALVSEEVQRVLLERFDVLYED